MEFQEFPLELFAVCKWLPGSMQQIKCECMCDGKGEYAIAVLTFFRKEREVSSAGTSRFGRKQLMLYYFDGYGLQALF